MNGLNRVAVVREAITKITQILADMGIRVTQQGISAYVQSDDAGKPVRVNLPFIPDEAPEELIDAVNGFLDHEIGHVLFSDFGVLGTAMKENYKFFLNALEDTRIERKMAERYTGSANNLSTTLDFFLKHYIEPQYQEAIQKGDSVEAAQILFVPLIRAMAGQVAAQQYLADKEHIIKPVRDLIGDLESKIQAMDSTADAVTLAKEIKKRVSKKEDPKPSEEPKDDDKKGKSSKSEKSKDKDSDKSENQPPAGEDEEDDTPAESEPKDKDTEEDETENSNSKDDSSDSDEDEKESDGSSKGGDEDDKDEEDDEREGEGEDDESSDSDDGDDSAGDDDSADDEDGDSDDAGDDAGSDDGDSEDAAIKGDGAEQESGESSDSKNHDSEQEFEHNSLIMDALDKDSASDDDYDSSLSSLITREVVDVVKDEEYVVYTNDYDVIEPLRLGSGFKPEMLKHMQDSVDHMVGTIQKDLERAMNARSMAKWQGGLRKGRINPAALARTAAGDDRVFRQKEEANSKDVAVELVVDMSGSMRSQGKINLAAQAAYALAATLDRMGIKSEVICFTTKETPTNVLNEMKADERKLGSCFSRYDSLYMPIVKGFNERMSTDVKNRFAWLPNVQDLRSNIDGESIRIAANRLLTRRETGKIMMVLSDGMPAGASHADLPAHLYNTVREITSQGVKVVGIGIMTDAVRKFYPKNVVINNVNDLPTTVIKELRQMLL